jgi:amidase
MAPAHPIAPVENRLRLGWAPQPAGLPVDQEIAAVLAKAPSLLSGLGHHVEEIALEALSDAMEIFKINRAASYAALAGELYHQHKDKLKPTLATNIAQGLQLTDADIEKAERSRQRVSVMLNTLFDTYDYLLMPSTQVMPFPIETEYPTEINGQAMSSYIDWMSVCCILSPFGVPCLSVPAGFSATGLPVGLQIVGRPQDDSGVLQLAYLFQQHTHYWKQQPDMAW